MWPLVGAGLQGALLFAPLVAAVLAAGSSYAVEQAIIAPWRPAAPSDAEVEEACARAEKYFQVTAPPERAGPRAAAFRAAADRWRDDRRADERRDYYRAAATAGSAAVAGTWLAPCLAQLVAFGLAVVGGRMLAARISEKHVAVCGGLIFLGFAVYSFLVEDPQA